MSAYYNENDPGTAAWLRAIMAAGEVPDGVVDERSIEEVQADDLRGFTQCHFFAGIGGWPYAARLAGWPEERELWTGSCPCQPFSSAARGRNSGTEDRRHLWPIWHDLIVRRRPSAIVGEQVARARHWLDEVCGQMEASGYAFWAGILPAVSVGADHARERIYFAGYANGDSQPIVSVDAEVAGVPGLGRLARGMVPANDVSPVVSTLGGFGNAIVPPLGAEVIRSLSDAIERCAA